MFGNNVLGVGSRTLNLPTILNGISKTLGIVNQAIPIYQQAKPMIQKGKMLFKLANEFNKSDVSKNTKPSNQNKNESIQTKAIKNTSLNKPVFFQ